MNNDEPLAAEKTAWYDKEVVSFSDLLRTIRTRLWRDSLFFRKRDKAPSDEINEGEGGTWSDWLVEALARTA